MVRSCARCWKRRDLPVISGSAAISSAEDLRETLLLAHCARLRVVVLCDMV